MNAGSATRNHCKVSSFGSSFSKDIIEKLDYILVKNYGNINCKLYLNLVNVYFEFCVIFTSLLLLLCKNISSYADTWKAMIIILFIM